MRGFIVYSTYRVEEEGAFVYLFGRLENGESFISKSHFRPYFFIKDADRCLFKNVETEVNYDPVDCDMINFDGKRVLKIIAEDPKDVPILKKEFEEAGIDHYESDIRFVQRFLIDNEIKGSFDIEGDYQKGSNADRIYVDPVIRPSEHMPELKTVAIDIETNMGASEIYCISLFGEDCRKVLIRSDGKHEGAESYSDEKTMLEAFKAEILELDPDIITGWNMIDFDLNVLKIRFKAHNIPFLLGRNDWPCRLRIFDSFLRDSSANIPGRMVLDGIHLVKTSFIRLEDYKLDTAAKEILGREKLKVFDYDNKGEEIERLFLEDKQKLINYNLKDSELVFDILKEKSLIRLTVLRSILTGMPLDRVRASIASLDSLYIRETRKKGIVCNPARFNERTSRISGGFVQESKPGFYKNIVVLDFKSLYPSIIRTFNIDPLAFLEEVGNLLEKDLIMAPNGAMFKKEEGILPELIKRLWKQRDLAKKRKNIEESYAIKITMNSFFGVLANPMCRFYSLKMANAITAYGRMIVKKTAELSEEKGYPVIYGDTDSIFVDTGADDAKRAERIGVKISKMINKHWDKYVKSVSGRESVLELQYEKTYKRFMMPMIRGRETGAKKRYAGLLDKDGEDVLDFKGLEIVRRDWTDLAKKFQSELFDMVFHDKDTTQYVKEFVGRLKKGELDHLIVYRKALRKELDEYTKTTPPHVKAARMLDKIRSSIITYVMTTEGPEPTQKLSHPIDYEHYIEKQLKPIADSILVFFDKSFDDVVKGSSQKTLFGY